MGGAGEGRRMGWRAGMREEDGALPPSGQIEKERGRK